MTASAGIRLAVSTTAEVKGDLTDIQQTGVGAYDAIADAGDQSAQRQLAAQASVSASARSAAADAEASLKRITAQQQAAIQASADRANLAFRATMSPQASGLDLSGVSAKSSANAIGQQMAQQEAAAAALIARLDPLTTAQNAYNKSLADYRQMAAYGVISATQLAQAEALAKKAYDDATKGLGGLNGAIKLNQTQQSMLGSAVYRTFESFSSGLPVWKIASEQGGEVAAALGMGDGGVGGSLAALKAIITPTVIAATGFVAVLAAGTAAAIMHALSMKQLTTATQGFGAAAGITAQQAEGIAQAAAKTGEVSIGQARGAEAAFLNTGRIGSQMFGQLINLTEGYSELTGTKFKDAEGVMAQSFGTGAAGVAALNQKLDFLSAAQEEHIKLLFEEGDQTDAVAQAMALFKDRIAGAADSTGGWTDIVHGLANAWDGVGAKVDEVIKKIAQEAAAYKGILSGAPPLTPGVSSGPTAAQDQRSHDLKAAASALNPQADQIADRTAQITALKAALNDKTGQQLALAGLTRAAAQQDIKDGEAEVAELQKRSQHLDEHAAALARDSEALEANTRGTLTLAQAYLAGDDTALKAEADRKAATTSIKQQADLQKAQADQLAAAFAEQQLAGAKQVATLRDQVNAMAGVNASTAAGLITADQAARLIEQENQTRALQIAQLAAVKAGREADADAMQDQITALNNLISRQQQEQAAQKNLAEIQANDNTNDQLYLQLTLLGKTNIERATALAQMQAQQQLAANGTTPLDPTYAPTVRSKVASAKMSSTLDAASTFRSQTQSLQDQIAILRTRQGLLGLSADDAQKMVDELTKEQSLRVYGSALTDQERQNLISMVGVQDDLTTGIKRMNDAWSEGQSFTNKLLDDLESGKSVTKDIVAELLKLEVSNPLDNLLFNSNLPTGGDVFSALRNGLAGGAFNPATQGLTPNDLLSMVPGVGPLTGANIAAAGGGSTGILGAATSMISSIFGFANGTDGAPPGWAWVGEDGPELMKMQGGEKVRSTGNSMKMLAQAVTPPAPVVNTTVNIHANDSVVYSQMMATVRDGVRAAHADAIATAYGQAPTAVAQAQTQGRL